MLSVSAPAQLAPDMNVTTWHNDKNRTGWQSFEATLTPSNVSSNFGLLWTYTVTGVVDAQPHAVQLPGSVQGCTGSPCNLVVLATEQDMLYGVDADSAAIVWSRDLAGLVGGQAVDCTQWSPPCAHTTSGYLGVMGTPVIDQASQTVFVVSLVQFGGSKQDGGHLDYYLHAINLTTGQQRHAPQEILATGISGKLPSQNDPHCLTALGTGTIDFDPEIHLQRAGLLLLTSGATDSIYFGFAPADGEVYNGWAFGYTFNTGTSTWGGSAVGPFVSTPYGTGGGIWQSGAGLASDGTYIYVPTGNGTFDTTIIPRNDYADSILKLRASDLTVADHFTPSDVTTYGGTGRCDQDEDLASGGILLFPESFFPGYDHLMISADKESKFFVIDRDNLTGYNPMGDLIVQEITAPSPPANNQGYWTTPVYWKSISGGATARSVYFSPAIKDPDHNGLYKPLPIYKFTLVASTPGPVVSAPAASTTTLFCGHGAVPALSSSGTSSNTGILWAIESYNTTNPTDCSGSYGSAVLHAYAASDLHSLFDSSAWSSLIGPPSKFSTPIIFHGRVYIGTRTNAAAFGSCGGGGCTQP